MTGKERLGIVMNKPRILWTVVFLYTFIYVYYTDIHNSIMITSFAAIHYAHHQSSLCNDGNIGLHGLRGYVV